MLIAYVANEKELRDFMRILNEMGMGNGAVTVEPQSNTPQQPSLPESKNLDCQLPIELLDAIVAGANLLEHGSRRKMTPEKRNAVLKKHKPFIDWINNRIDFRNSNVYPLFNSKTTLAMLSLWNIYRPTLERVEDYFNAIFSAPNDDKTPESMARAALLKKTHKVNEKKEFADYVVRVFRAFQPHDAPGSLFNSETLRSRNENR